MDAHTGAGIWATCWGQRLHWCLYHCLQASSARRCLSIVTCKAYQNNHVEGKFLDILTLCNTRPCKPGEETVGCGECTSRPMNVHPNVYLYIQLQHRYTCTESSIDILPTSKCKPAARSDSDVICSEAYNSQ